MNRLNHWASGLAFAIAAAAPAAWAAPVVGGVLAGERGQGVSLVVSDDLSDFEAADIRVTFDTAVLRYTGSSFAHGLIGVNATVPGQLTFSLPVGGSPLNGPTQLFTVLFDIDLAAPLGASTVAFASLDASIYDRAPFNAQITVNDRVVGVTLAPTLALASLGLMLVPAFARRSAARPLSA